MKKKYDNILMGITMLLCIFPACAQWVIHGDGYLGPSDELYIHFPLTKFEHGIFSVNREGGSLTFNFGASWQNGSDNAHIDGPVTAITSSFVFPIGDRGVFQPLSVHEYNGGRITVTYIHDAHSDLKPSAAIEKIHNKHYWRLVAAPGKGKLTLRWNLSSNLTELLDDAPLAALGIAGYNGNSWELLPATLNENTLPSETATSLFSGSITTDAPVALDMYAAVALVAKKMVGHAPGVVVAEGLTPNNDGVNDSWYIRGIENHPQARIRVYSRTGEMVFKTDNGYNNDWEGHFKKNKNTVPAGPYFYTIDLNADGQHDSSGWLYVNY